MKSPLLFLLFLVPLFVFSQSENYTQLIYLKDGSILRGTVQENVDTARVQVTLTDGSVIHFQKNLLLQTRDSKAELVMFANGRRILEKGWYSSISFHSLTAKRSTENTDNELRWGLGGHFSTGYRFSSALGIGGGIGLDAHEYFFMPVFAELTGYFVKKEFRNSKNTGPEGRHLSIPGESKTKWHTPVCYSLQVGYNVPIEELFRNDEFEQIGGGAIIYPAVGWLFPSRSGTTFRFDAGYKFQQFSRTYTQQWWGNYEVRDNVWLQSLALRAGWIF